MNSLRNCQFSKHIDWEDEHLKIPGLERILAVLATLKIKLVTIEMFLDCNSSPSMSLYAFWLASVLKECKALCKSCIYLQCLGGRYVEALEGSKSHLIFVPRSVFTSLHSRMG